MSLKKAKSLKKLLSKKISLKKAKSLKEIRNKMTLKKEIHMIVKEVKGARVSDYKEMLLEYKKQTEPNKLCEELPRVGRGIASIQEADHQQGDLPQVQLQLLQQHEVPGKGRVVLKLQKSSTQTTEEFEYNLKKLMTVASWRKRTSKMWSTS
eukprot:GFUD01129530.1.p1 GENE.GFUD01129530.1~~GFUD01129530.1.p1  ORF type:complete len:152 (+),score=37.39 GFUD01129530.1:74-529(+)